MPSNMILTPSLLLKESYAIMHQKGNFIARSNRQYDNRFQASGVGKGGEILNIRLPPKFTVRTGDVMQQQNVVQRQVPLPRSTVMGIDFVLGQQELSKSINSVSEDILKPAISQLTASVEANFFDVYKTVANYAGSVLAPVTYKSFQQVGQYMSEELTPTDNQRTMTQSPQARVDFSDAVKGLFQSASRIDEQYVEGKMGSTGGFEVYENTITPAHTVGVYGGVPLTNGALQGTSGAGNAYASTTTLVTDGWTATTTILKKGDILTLGTAGAATAVNAVHPETKVSYGRLRRFTVVSDTVTDGAGNSSVVISPAIIYGGAYQNVTVGAADGLAITVLGASGTTYGQSLGFYKDAFAFVTADLEDPSMYGAWGAREVFDGISMRIWRQGDIANGSFPCRLDICFGWAAIYPEWSARHVYQLA